MASTRTLPPDSAATVKPHRIDLANESSTDFTSSGFLLLDRNDWLGWIHHARADALEARGVRRRPGRDRDRCRSSRDLRRGRSRTGNRCRTARSRKHRSRALVPVEREVTINLFMPLVRSSIDGIGPGRCCCALNDEPANRNTQVQTRTV